MLRYIVIKYDRLLTFGNAATRALDPWQLAKRGFAAIGRGALIEGMSLAKASRMLWLALAVMTGLAVFALLWPLARKRAGPEKSMREADFYRAQLDEIERDVSRGALPAAEAASARAETARRLIAASAPGERSAPAEGALGRRRAAAVVILVLVPAVALGVYLTLGAPDLPDAPLASRSFDPATPEGLRFAIAKVESVLAAHPDDARGWRVIAPVYMRLGRFADAAGAYQRSIELEGDSGALEADLGEARLAAANGVVDAGARAAFEKALQMTPGLPKARFYLAYAAEQAGDPKTALAVYRELAPQAKGSATWVLGLESRLAALDGEKAREPQFTADQQKTIQGMVVGLASRLASQGGSADQWARLIRAYSVLKDQDKAKAALADARKAYASDAAALAHFDTLARELGL